MGPRDFKGLASFHPVAPRFSKQVGLAMLRQGSARGSPNPQAQDSRWSTAYRRVQGPFRVASAIPDDGDAVSDPGGGASEHMEEIEEHALALLLRVPSRGELQMQRDAAAAVAGDGADGTAAGAHGWGLARRARQPPAAAPPARARESQVKLRWSTAAGAVGEGCEAAADGGRVSAAREAAQLPQDGVSAASAILAVDDIQQAMSPASELRDDGATPQARLPIFSRMKPPVDNGNESAEQQVKDSRDPGTSKSSGGGAVLAWRTSLSAVSAAGGLPGGSSEHAVDSHAEETPVGNRITATGANPWLRAKGLATTTAEEPNAPV